MNIFSVCVKFLGRYALIASLLMVGFWACKSVGPIEVEQDKYDLPGITVVDTVIVHTNEYTYYRLTADQPWILIDTQTVYDGDQQITFIALENVTGEQRTAKITISGEDLTPKEIEVVQQAGGGYGANLPDEPLVSNIPGGQEEVYVESAPRPSRKRIRTESALVELPAAESEETPPAAPAPEEPLPEKKEEKEKGPILTLSSDQINLGAAENLTSDEVALTANKPWKLSKKDDWIEIVDATGAPISEGSKSQIVKIKTTKANTALEDRTTEIVFSVDSIRRTMMVVQKATEASLEVSPKEVSLDGNMASAKATLDIEAVATNFEITGMPSWLKVSPVSGRVGKTEIALSVSSDNTGATARTATLTISSTGKVIQKTVNITQNFLPSPIQVEELAGNLERDKESIQTFTITASKDWTIKVPENVKWFTIDQKSGTASEEEYTITVTATEDNTGLPRKAVIQVVSGKFTRNVTVIQDGDQEGDAVEEAPIVEQAPEEAPAAQAPTQEAAPASQAAEPSEVENPEITVVSGSSQGEFTSYVLLGNPRLYGEDPNTIPASVVLTLKSNTDFIIESEPFDNMDTFFTIYINQNKYKYGDVIKKGEVQLTFQANTDNIQKKDDSKIGHILFKTPSKKPISFKDPIMNPGAEAEPLEKFEIKQEAYQFKRPYIKVYGLDFDGYNSNILLGNPGSKGEDALPTTISFVVNANTAFALTLLTEDGDKKKNSQFIVSYATAKNANKRYSYKMGEKLDPGEYTFTLSVKKNYTDPQGVSSRYTESFVFNIVEGKNLTPYEYIDMDNYSVDLSYFRELFLVEQESFE